MTHNRLSLETSPYLLQHSQNPVWWYPWGAEAFEAARREDKPVFLSIGYSTCYWCHVMEQDSFESERVAELLNQRFICTKVDREERPDVDQVYMEAVTALTGHGGWPMSVFLTPDRQPFWGGTFFPREQFLKILRALADAWQQERAKVLNSAEHIVSALSARSEQFAEEGGVGRNALGRAKDLLVAALGQFSESFDEREGGFGNAPKFPPAVQISLLLRVSQRLSESEASQQARQMAICTLEKMARGGLFDQLGGGFHRYSTDSEWLVPHFEKMLYDNGLLAVSCLEAFQLTKDKWLAEVARDTLNYISRDLGADCGAFYSAEDAGEVGREGEFYVWSEAELREVLGADRFKQFGQVYSLPKAGNFEQGKLILTVPKGLNWSARYAEAFRPVHAEAAAARARRRRPRRDEKIITAWNGLAVTAFAKGFQVLGDSSFLRAARSAAEFIIAHLALPSGLSRIHCGGRPSQRACLDDYAYLIEGLIELYCAEFDQRWLAAAVQLQNEQDSRLWDVSAKSYKYSDAPELFFQKREYVDGATPSPNATALLNLVRLHALTHDPLCAKRCAELTTTLQAVAGRYPSAFAKTLIALDVLERGVCEVTVDTPMALQEESFIAWAHQTLLPHVVLSGRRSVSDDVAKISVCRSGTCVPPQTDSQQLRIELSKVPYL